MIRKSLFAGIFVCMLLSCSGSPQYIHAEKPGDYGYFDTKIQENVYRVSYKGSADMHPTYIKNYLLYRCAELTIDSGYQYFIILEYDLLSNDVLLTETTIEKKYDNSDQQNLKVPSIDTVITDKKAKELEVIYLIQFIINTEQLSPDIVIFNALEIINMLDATIEFD